MAGSSMTFTETTIYPVKKIKCAWTSDSSTNAVSGTTTNPYFGKIVGAITVPGTGSDAPDDNYNIALNDSDSVDVALGALATRDTANTEYVASASMAGIVGKITVAVSAAGASNKGTLYLFIQ